MPKSNYETIGCPSQKAVRSKSCEWKPSKSYAEFYNTSCNNVEKFIWLWVFCPYCGRKIVRDK